MALSTQEQEILNFAKANGKTPAETKLAIQKYRATVPAATTTPSQPVTTNPNSAMSDIKTGFSNAVGAINAGVDREIAQGTENRSDQSRRFGRFANGLRTAGDALGSIGAGVFRALPGGTTVSNAIEGVAKAGAEKAAPSLVQGFDWAKSLVPAGAENTVKDLGNVALGGLGIAGSVTGGAPAVNAAKTAGKAVVDATVDASVATGKAVTNSPIVKGALQTGIDYTERVPRFIGRREQELRDQATKAERLATAPEPIKKAIQAGVSEPIINTIEQADAPTREGYRQIVQLAEETISTDGTLKATARPEIVAGEAASTQYKLIDQKRKEVGQAIGKATKALSKTTAVPMRQSYQALDDQLADIGVGQKYTDKGVVLDFSRSGFSKQQRTKIQELYDLATEGGDSLTPFEIHDKDRLFSQLQREARMEGMGDILVDTPTGKMSLFSVFRDVYSSNLDTLSPEIKQLNSQYRNLKTFTDDIESSIVKSGKFETNSRIDPAEYAQTNLRRLFSESASAADYRAIADELDNAARALGYQGGKPEDLARFAYEIRKIYPETTPRTGFEGGIRASVGGLVDSVLTAGKADLVDQQKALRELFQSIDDVQQ